MKKSNNRPPEWIQQLIERYCEPFLFEGIAGDLEELFIENSKLKGNRRARLIYLFQAIGFFRLLFKKQSSKSSNMKAIWTNYFITSFRSLRRHRVFFFINLIGLITAITCGLYAFVFIYDESNFNKQLEGQDIYRVYKRHINETEGVDHLTYETSGMMGPTMQVEYPEVEESMRFLPWWGSKNMLFENKNYVIDKFYAADSNFFTFLNKKLILGDPKTALDAPASIVLSMERAKAIFGENNPLGETLVGIGDVNFTVTGVYDAAPRQSSMQYDAVVSWTTFVGDVGPLDYSWMNNWLAQAIFTYVKIKPGTQISAVETKMEDMMNRHFPERADHYFLKFIPIEDMYLLGEDIRGDHGLKTGSITFVLTLGLSAFLIFLIASVNYVNIMLSRASQTHKEVGVRKVMGSTRRQLMGRFITETLITSVLASILSIGLLLFFLPSLNELTDKEIPLIAFFQPVVLLSVLGFILMICAIVGVYPAYILSSPTISVVLQGGASLGGTGWLRKILLTFQYAVSVFLLICTITVIRQTSFLKNKPLGFNKDNILVVGMENEVGDQNLVFENELLVHPNIEMVSSSRSAIGGGSYSTTTIPEGYTDELVTRMFHVDQEFFETYGIKIIQGRSFLKGSVADSNNLIINREMATFLGWEDPIGKRIRFSPKGQSYPIIGVIENFHYSSLASSTIEPMVLMLETERIWNASVRIGQGDLRETMTHIESVWQKLADNTPIDFYFIDEWFDSQYKKETQLLKIASAYSIVSILLCALGLYSMTALLLQQKQKEISIRKVLGASLSSIISLVNKRFLGIIAVAFVLASPLAYQLVQQWLDRFEYSIEVGLIAFFFAGLFTLLISIAIISILSIKTANTNPSKTLSQE